VWVVLSDRVMQWANGQFSLVPSHGFVYGVEPPLRVVERTNQGGVWAVAPTGDAVFEGGHVSAWTRADGLPKF
jgi:hypothetical protein